MLNSMVMFSFSGLDQKNLRNSKYAELYDDVRFFCFRREIPFLEKLVPNHQSCYKFLFKLFGLIKTSFCFGHLVKIPKNF